jgi:hypothetical protein
LLRKKASEEETPHWKIGQTEGGETDMDKERKRQPFDTVYLVLPLLSKKGAPFDKNHIKKLKQSSIVTT